MADSKTCIILTLQKARKCSKMNGDMSKGQRVHVKDILNAFWENTGKGVNEAGFEEGQVEL